MNPIFANRIFRALILLAAVAEFSANTNAQPSGNSAPAALHRRASIIFIQVDGLGYGDLSCYGQTNFQTPNLDKLAADGIRFTNYFVTNTTSESLMFGEKPQNPNIDMPRMSVAQILKSSGYHNGLIGQWNLGDENSGGAPWKSGFDEFAGYLNPNDAGNFYINYIFRYAPKSFVDTNNIRTDFIGREELYPNDDGKRQEYIPDLLTTAAMNFVQNNVPDQFNHYRPFFLLLNYKIPAGKIEVPTDAPFSEEAWPQPEKNKAALISRIDGYIGQLQEQLKKTGLTNDVVIFFSGAGVPKKYDDIDPAFFHSNNSADDFRVPMIAGWPGTIPAGQVSGLNWSAQDFLPTAAQIGYAQPPKNIGGKSVLRTLLGRAEK